jgi:hypothetical protein
MEILKPIFSQQAIGLLTEDTASSLQMMCALIVRRCDSHKFGENARALAEGDLSWNHIVDKLKLFYDRILEQ